MNRWNTLKEGGDDMQRYYMRASNGSVVHHESDTGGWLKYDEVDYEMSTLRYEKEEAVDRVKALELRVTEREELIMQLDEKILSLVGIEERESQGNDIA
jgi:hypothetical protein